MKPARSTASVAASILLDPITDCAAALISKPDKPLCRRQLCLAQYLRVPTAANTAQVGRAVAGFGCPAAQDVVGSPRPRAGARQVVRPLGFHSPELQPFAFVPTEEVTIFQSTQPANALAQSATDPTYRTRAAASPQSTTSSALISIAAGIVSPSDSSVFLLITRRNWVGCSNGRSAGSEPFKIRSARPAARS
jgi:hypothetical protein